MTSIDPHQRIIRVHFLPPTLGPGEINSSFSDSTCVVIDLLRATTTICHALAAGATEILACQTIEDAHAARASALSSGAQASDLILGGERGGVKISRFDLGNSPTEYTPATVAGKRVIFTTTNGTRAIAACHGARRIVLASLANLSALCRSISAADTIDIVCAGTDGQLTAEDVLTAGAIVEQFTREGLSNQPRRLNDEAQLALAAWRTISNAEQPEKALLTALYMSRGGANLLALSYARDIEIAAQIDTITIVPEVTSSTDARWATIRSPS